MRFILICTVGRYCEYQNANSDRSSEFTSFEEYSATLRLECDRGQAGGESGVYTWTPDKNTPDTVYYQVSKVLAGAAEPVRLVRFWPDHFSAIK